MKFALGTVQFGLPYGIANTKGQVNFDEARNILDFAEKSGIDTLDTAIAYGNSEQVLGKIGVKKWNTISKLPAIPEACSDVTAWLNSQFSASLKRLCVNKLHGLLLHTPSQLFEPQGIELYTALCRLKQNGFVEKIGVSIYDPNELNDICANFDIDIVQVAFNIIDRRLLDSGWMKKLADKNIEIHSRSALLQGLLLMSSAARPIKFNRWQPLWERWHNWLDETGLSPLQASLNYVLSQNEISKVIIGVDTKLQLEEILQAVSYELHNVPDKLCSLDLELINPSNWQNL